MPGPLELSSKLPSQSFSIVLNFKLEASCVLKASCLLPGRFQRGGAGVAVAGGGRVFQVELLLGVGEGLSPPSFCAWHELVLCVCLV